MTTMPEIRKSIKFFANGKNKPLVKLASMVMDTEEVLAVLVNEQPSEFNTCLQVRRDLFPTLPTDSYDVPYDKRYHQRNIMYDRIDISEALRIEFAKKPNGAFEIDPESFYEDPVPLQDFIDVLNKKYGYDMTTDDITITYTSNNNYTITAKPNSLQYFGQASVDLGSEDDTPPPIKIPSHDSVWDLAVIDLNKPALINGNNVDLKNLQAMYNAGIALMQYKTPDMAWLLWTGGLSGEGTISAVDNKAIVANVNVNETLTVNGTNLFAKYVPFVPSTDIPVFTNPITAADFKKTMQFMFPHAESLDKIVGFWIDDHPVKITDLLKPAGMYGFKMTMDSLGDSVLIHDGIADARVSIRVAVPTLPALARVNSRFVYGIQRNGNNIPLDATGREIYHIRFPAKEVIVPDPSDITPIIPGNQEDYIAALDKVASGLTLNYTDYLKAKPSLQTTAGKRQLTATVESETYENRFPAFYFIKEKDWVTIESQPTNTVLGSYIANTIPAINMPITVGLLQANTVPVTNGRLLCIVGNIPANHDASFRLNYQPGSDLYVETVTPLRFDIAYNKASLIIPRELDETILKDITAGTMSDTDFEDMWLRQNDVRRFVNQVGEKWYASYEFSPYNRPEVLVESLDDNGLYILQLMSIPGTGMAQIQGIAARDPSAIILRLTDSGGINTRNMTALDIIQQAVLQPVTGDGYLCFKHSKQSGATQVKWVFKTDYDEKDFTYRETTTEFTITDSIIDNPSVPFNVSYQECSNQDQYTIFTNIVGAEWPSDFYTWKEHNLNIASNSSTGIFTRYGEETRAAYSAGRLLLSTEHLNWFRDGDYTQFPDQDPVVIKIKCAEVDASYEVKASYLQAHVNQSGGIPIPLPKFDDQNRILTWTLEFSWFGFTNPPRPAPSPLPNLMNGTISSRITNLTKPIQKLPSLFEFTDRFSAQEMVVMRNNLITEGKPLEAIEKVVSRYDTIKMSDQPTQEGEVTIGRIEQDWFTTWGTTRGNHLVVQVIAVDLDILNAFKNGTFTEQELDSVVYTYTPTGQLETAVDRTITIRQIRERGIISAAEGFIPVVGQISYVESFSNPNQETQNWKANFSKLDSAGDMYEERIVKLITKVFVTGNVAAGITLNGPNETTDAVALDALAKRQWPAKNLIPVADQDLTSNNNFGLWNVTFLNKGKTGFEVLKFSTEALRLLNTAKLLSPSQKIFTVQVKANINNYSQTYSYTANEILTLLGAGDSYTVPLEAFIVRGNYEYTIGINLSYSGSTSDVPNSTISNTTSVKDGTPPDITVDARWTVPTSDIELAQWCGIVGLSPITMEQYAMSVTQYHYTHRVVVEQSNVEYVAAIKIEKSVRERLIENQYAPDTIVGLLDGTELLVSNFTEGVFDENGDNIILIRAPISVATDNAWPLSFSISGIADYNQLFTGRDVPVVVASDVIVTKIQNDMTQVLANLRAALNPIADVLITKNEVQATITETASAITNIVNNASRDSIGKTWVIPVGILKEQVDILQPGSWMVVKTVGTGINVTVNSDQLKQYASEGWTYTDVESKQYYIYPILFTFEDRDGAVKLPFQLTAGSSIGRWTPWFTNYVRNVNFEYSIRQIRESEVSVIIPDTELFNKLLARGAGGSFGFVRPEMFRKEKTIDGQLVKVDDILLESDDNKLLPIFVTFQAEQVDQALDDVTVATLSIVRYRRDPDSGDLVSNALPAITLNKAAIKNTILMDGVYYFTLGHAVEGIEEFYLTVTATVDYDLAGGDWLSGTDSNGVGGLPGYNVDCTGALNHVGVLEVDSLAGSSLVSSNGVIVEVTNDEEFINLLRSTLALDVVELTTWVDPNPQIGGWGNNFGNDFGAEE